jgi:hypothetical protein
MAEARSREHQWPRPGWLRQQPTRPHDSGEQAERCCASLPAVGASSGSWHCRLSLPPVMPTQVVPLCHPHSGPKEVRLRKLSIGAASVPFPDHGVRVTHSTERGAAGSSATAHCATPESCTVKHLGRLPYTYTHPPGSRRAMVHCDEIPGSLFVATRPATGARDAALFEVKVVVLAGGSRRSRH